MVPDNGVFSIVFGSMNPLYLDHSVYDLFYLGVKVDSDAEMTPRQEVTSVGSAHTAWTALNVVCTGCVSPAELSFTPGDITAVNTAATSGLTVGSTSGDVALNVNFAGGGTTNTVARSDHNHDAAYVNVAESNSVTSAMIHDGAIMNTDINASAAIAGSKLASDGSVMKSLIPGANVSVTNNNNGSWTVNSTSGSSGWSLTGNASTTPGTNFIGTTDNQALEVKVNNTRALRIEPNATSPNIIGGYSGNTILSGALGATISGGGESGNVNTITDDYGTIGGGGNNQTSNNVGTSVDATFATVDGGSGNVASGPASTVCGGSPNTAGGVAATVAGGGSNIASNLYTTVSGGGANTANAPGSTVGGGASNIASGEASSVGGGNSNSAENYYSTVAGGAKNVAGGISSAVGGGAWNAASAALSTVLGGYEASADQYGQMAYAGSCFVESPGCRGKAQASLYVLRNITTDGNLKELFLDGELQTERIKVGINRTMTFEILVTARSSAGDSGGFKIWGTVENYFGTTSLIHAWGEEWGAR